ASQSPVFLLNSRHPLLSATPLGFEREALHLAGAHLLPKLRCQFAEFLSHGSLKRLGILYPSTCVGLRYGHRTDSLRGFSPKYRLTPSARSKHRARRPFWALVARRLCLPHPPTGLSRDIQHPAGLPSFVTPSFKRPLGGAGILTCCPSPTPFGLGLGTD